MALLNIRIREKQEMKKEFFVVLVVALFFCSSALAQTRVKDVARIEGIEETQLIGYGIVVGLDGSGDGARTQFTVQSVVNMLRNLGVVVPSSHLRLKNVAAVMVTSTLPPFAKKGNKLDVTVSSMGDASSLEGGTLLMTPLQDATGEILALAQGALSVGGYSIGKVKSTMRKKNHALAGQVPGGAIVKQEVVSNIISAEKLRLSLMQPDFTSAVEMARAINAADSTIKASAVDASTVDLLIPEKAKLALMELISRVENVKFEPAKIARVVINEKTGTIVAGAEVTISEVAVSHGAISVSVQQTPMVSQPQPLSLGTSETVTRDSIAVSEDKPEFVVLPRSTSVGDLARALNQIGATPRDIMAIFQAIKHSGSLNAELIVM